MSGLDRFRWALVATAALAFGGGAAAVIGSQRQQSDIALALTGGDASRAPPLMRRYGCAGCHTIPGISGADGLVGASLKDLRSRAYVAGVLPNNADNLVKWIVSPTDFNPRSAMPRTGISESEARDVAAYLYGQ